MCFGYLWWKKSGRSSCLEEQAYLTGRLWGNWYFLHNLSPRRQNMVTLLPPTSQRRKNLSNKYKYRQSSEIWWRQNRVTITNISQNLLLYVREGSCSPLQIEYNFLLKVGLFLWMVWLYYPIRKSHDFNQNYQQNLFGMFWIYVRGERDRILWESNII